MKNVQSISFDQFDKLRSHLTNTLDQWTMVKLERDKTFRHEANISDITEIINDDLLGTNARHVLVKTGSGDEKLTVKSLTLNLEGENMYLFRYNDDDRIIVVNPDKEFSEIFFLNDASWWNRQK